MQNDSNGPVAGANGTDSLGEPIRVFRVDPKCVSVAGTAFYSCVLVGFGIFTAILPAVLAEGGELLGSYTPPLIISLGALGLAYVYLVLRSAILVCPGGVIKVKLWKNESCRWDDVIEIVEINRASSWVFRRWVLAKKDGSRMKLIDRRLIEDFETLIGLIREQAALRGIPCKEKQPPGELVKGKG